MSLVFLLGAVAAGVGFQVPNTANLEGYRAELMKHGIRAGFGDVRVRAAGLSHIPDGQAVATRLRADRRVLEATAVITLPGAIGKSGQFRGAAVFGVDMSGLATPFRLLSGALLASDDDHGIIVGSSLAARLGIDVGDDIQLRVIFDGSGNSDDDDDVTGRYTAVVRGLAGGAFGASQSVFVSYDFLAGEAGLAGAASNIYVYLDDHDEARRLAQAIDSSEDGVEASAWLDDDPFIRSAVESSRAIGVVSEAMVIFAVAIPVLALLFINVLRKRRDIGLLSALGFSPLEIFAVFALQAAIIGAAGCALGCGLGYGLVAYFQAHAIFAYEGFVIEPSLSWLGFARPALVVFAVTAIAGAYPAWRAARLDPAPVLRGVA